MAFGSGTVNSFAGAAGDLFNAEAHRYKARGAQFEKENYDAAAEMADRNAGYTRWTTEVKEQQSERATFQGLGRVQSDVAGAGLKMSGSALDLLSESAANGVLAKEVLGTQGEITEEGYRVQAQSYRNMSDAANVAIEAENNAATGSTITAGLRGVAAVTSLFTG